MENLVPDLVLADANENKPANCPYCKIQLTGQEKFCPNCAYPISGTEYEKDQFGHEWNRRTLNIENAQKEIKTARTTLYVIAGLVFVASLIVYALSDKMEYLLGDATPTSFLIAGLIVGAIYIGLAEWTKKQPLPATVIGLSLYVILQVISAFDNPSSLIKGVVIKIIIIGYLVRGVKAAFNARNLMAEVPEIHN